SGWRPGGSAGCGGGGPPTCSACRCSSSCCSCSSRTSPACCRRTSDLAAAEGRGPPLAERRQALPQVVAGPGPLAGGGRAGQVLEHRLVRPQGQRRQGGDLVGPGQRVLRRAQPLDEAEAVGVGP